MSTNKTQHHGLHLWEPQDNVLRAEFNENSGIIDQALCWERVVTAEADGTESTLSIPVDGEELLKYARLELCVMCPGTNALNLLVNGITTGYTQMADVGSLYNKGNGTDLGCVYYGGGPSSLRFALGNPVRGTPVMSFSAGGGVNTYNNTCSQYNTCYLAPVTWEQVTSIDVLCRGDQVPAGTRITVYGLRG